MILQTNHFQFPVTLETELEDWEETYELLIGNPRHRPRPCVSIYIPLPSIGNVATLNALQYFSTCSFTHLERRSGTIEMLQGALKAMCTRFTHVETVTLTDTSHFQNKGIFYPLPEMQMLLYGETWYARHLKAVPSPYLLGTATTVRAWQRVRGLPVASTPFMNIPTFAASPEDTVAKVAQAIGPAFFTEENVASIVQWGHRAPFHLRPLTNTVWQISREVIMNYTTSAAFVMEGGDGRGTRFMRAPLPPPYLPRWLRGVWTYKFSPNSLPSKRPSEEQFMRRG